MEMSKSKQVGQKAGFSKGLMIALAAIVAVALGFWGYQLMAPVEIGGVSNISPWGSYIVAFMTFVGLSAGGLIVASSAHVFGIERFKKVALPAVIMSTVCICVAAAFVIVDLRSPEKMWRLFTGPNPLSPLTWDVCIISIYLIINIIDMVFIVRGDERKVTALSWFALPCAIMVHSVTAWIFALQVARMWYTAIMAPIFIVSACDSGLALLLLGLMWLERANIFKAGKALMKSLAGLLATFVAIDAFLIACELLTMGYPGAAEAEALAVIVSGAGAPYFWFEIIGGLIVPFAILVVAKNRENRTLVAISSVLIIAGVACKRIWLLFTGFVAPYAEGSPVVMSWAHGADALSATGLGAFYAPTIPEVIILIGVIALGTLAFMVLSQKLVPARCTVEETDEAPAPAAKPALDEFELVEA